jgi:soluble lytic murein transglycosylase
MRTPSSLIVALLAIAVALAVPPATAQPTDADLLAARAAFDRTQRDRFDAIAPRLKGHLLQPYVDYWGLRLRLDSATDAEVRAFIDANAVPALSRQLRADWLKSLARRGQWPEFAALYAATPGEDAELACYGIELKRQKEGDAALAAAKPLWFSGQALPDACEPLFNALIARGEISAAERRERFRLATQAGNVRLARAIAGELPGGDRITAAEFAPVDKDPARALAAGGFRWKEPGGRELALYALERGARTDAAPLRAAWEKQRGHLPEADRRYGNARIAYHAARQLKPEAHAWFVEAGDVPLGDVERGWRVRAALRAGAWSHVLATIDAMPPAQAGEQAWRYWRARALSAQGRGAEAEPVVVALAAEDGFYPLLAAETLGRGADKLRVLPRAAPAADDAWLATFGARADVRRAVKLAQLDLRPEMLREWAEIIRGVDDETLLRAADYARRQGLYDRAINTAERTAARHDFGLRYLTPYRDEFSAAARDHAVDEALLFAIARQESRFVADIVSSAGAVGLMQLMPATARWVAREQKRSDYRPERIADVATNTGFGAFYFKYWLDRLDSQPALAAAAYNAGPGRAQAWRNGAPLEGAIWVESIPFNETRDYVKKVLANAMYYTREMNQPYVALTARLGTVAPRGAASNRGDLALSP